MATKLLGNRVGVVSRLRAARRLRPDDHRLDRQRLRSALVVPSAPHWLPYKLLDGVPRSSRSSSCSTCAACKESVNILAPIFVLFIVTHVIRDHLRDRSPRHEPADGLSRRARRLLAFACSTIGWLPLML